MNTKRARLILSTLAAMSFCALGRADLPANWCGAEALEEEYVPCGEGACDSASTRNLWFPATGAAKTIIRIKFIIFADDGGGEDATTPFAVSQQVGVLNTAFQAYGIEFEQQSNTFVECTRFNKLCSDLQDTCHAATPKPCFRNNLLCRGDDLDTEEQVMKGIYAESPSTQLNVFVVDLDLDDTGFLGLGYGPWCDDATDDPGGIVIDGAEIGGTSGCGGGCRVLVHEIGHTLGLWHTYRGATEVLCGESCREGPDCDGDCPTDNEICDARGDFCCDTPATPRKPTEGGCEDPSTRDQCPPAGTFGETDETNYMWNGGNGCWDHFSRQQSARMHCWSCDTLSGWFVSEDCNNNSTKDICDIRVGYSDDCDENGVPDECQTDCNSNDIPDVCDITDETSRDCDENGVPDECHSSVQLAACCYGGDQCLMTTVLCCDELSGSFGEQSCLSCPTSL